MEKGTTSYILRGIPFCLWVAFTSFRKTWHKGQLLEDRGTEVTARGIQVKQKDSSVRGVIFRDLTWLDGSVCWSQIVMILLLGQEHEHGKTKYIPGKQVLVRSWLWKTNKQKLMYVLHSNFWRRPFWWNSKRCYQVLCAASKPSWSDEKKGQNVA